MLILQNEDPVRKRYAKLISLSSTHLRTFAPLQTHTFRKKRIFSKKMTDIDQHLENILPHFAKFANLWKAWPIAIPNLSTFNKTLANICSNCCRKNTNNFYLHVARIPVSGLFWKQANLSCNALGKRLTIQINKNIRDNISEMTQHGFSSNTRKKMTACCIHNKRACRSIKIDCAHNLPLGLKRKECGNTIQDTMNAWANTIVGAI